MAFPFRVCVVILPLVLLSGTGCSDTKSGNSGTSGSDHGHHHHHHEPTTLAEAMTELISLRDTIRDAFAAGDGDAAHDPLHEVGHVLEAFPKLAEKENVSAENREIIDSCVTTLMNAFGEVDKTMHGKEGSTYSEESDTIDKAILQLAAAARNESPASAAETPSSEGEGANSSGDAENSTPGSGEDNLQ